MTLRRAEARKEAERKEMLDALNGLLQRRIKIENSISKCVDSLEASLKRASNELQASMRERARQGAD